MIRGARQFQRATSLVFAGVLGFAAVVEMAHFRQYQKRKKHRMIFTGIAAAACLYMAAESLTGDWPSW